MDFTLALSFHADNHSLLLFLVLFFMYIDGGVNIWVNAVRGESNQSTLGSNPQPLGSILSKGRPS